MFEAATVYPDMVGEPVADLFTDVPHEPLDHLVDPDGPDHPTVGTVRPSGWLAFELDQSLDAPGRLSDAELIEAVIGFDRVASWAQAKQAELLAEFARRRPDDDAVMAQSDKTCLLSRYAPDEVGVALHLSRGAAMIRIGHAIALANRLPQTRQAWEHGLLDQRKVAAICDATDYLTDDHAAAVQDRVLPRAPGQTVAQLRAALARAVIAVDPDGAAARHREARKDRRVAVNPEPEGMASLWALLPAPDAVASYEWLTRLARGLGTDDPRGMDARRADIMVALLTGRLAPATPVTPGRRSEQVS